MIDLDKIRKNSKLTRDGFYHVVGAHYCVREAEFDALVEEVERLRAHRESSAANLLKGYETGKAEERAAVVAWLREHGSGAWLEHGGLSLVCLDEIADKFERGEHRNEEKS